jgi:hypothetical protein
MRSLKDSILFVKEEGLKAIRAGNSVAYITAKGRATIESSRIAWREIRKGILLVNVSEIKQQFGNLVISERDSVPLNL